MKLRKLARQLAAAAVAGAMALSLCMPALAETWNISNQPGFKEVYSINVTGTADGRTVELSGVDTSDEHVSASYTESTETVLSDSGAVNIDLDGRDAPVSVALNELDIMLEDISGSGACIRTDGDVSVDLRGENTLTIPDRRCIAAEKGSIAAGLEPGGTAGLETVGGIFGGSEALGYIVIGLLAFLLGVSVTILCFRIRRMDGQERAEEENGDEHGAD